MNCKVLTLTALCVLIFLGGTFVYTNSERKPTAKQSTEMINDTNSSEDKIETSQLDGNKSSKQEFFIKEGML